MKQVKNVGVVGAGTMGSALAQKFAQEGFTVLLADREMKFVEKGLNNIRTMLNEGVDKKVFSTEEVQSYLSNISGTENLEDLKKCDLIIEAIFEDFNAKSELFKTLSTLVPSDTILSTNTSSFSVSELSTVVIHPERFIGLHYFYHAAKNRLVEIIPGEKTSPETYKAMQVFSVQSGKDAITTKDSYGFAVNRFFVPWLNESCKLLEEGLASIAEIDTVCMKTFGIGMGPFALMNATGVPIALHAQKTLIHFGPSYTLSKELEQQGSVGKPWDLSGLENVIITPEKSKAVNDRMLGCVMFVCAQIIQEEVCSAVDLNRGAKIGLKWRLGPVDLMLKYGEAEVKRLVEVYSNQHRERNIPLVNSKKWYMEFVKLEINGNVAIITMSRPEDMNALNEQMVHQLDERFSKADTNPEVNTIVLTGSGKAFVAGADIKFFVNNMKANSINNIVDFTRYGQQVLAKIDRSQKKVVAILNGLALGGGMELALCADVLLALPKAKMAFPETGIGIYPGLGGTQRTAQRLGKGLAKYLVLTGQMLDSRQALEIGLIDGILQPEEVPDYISGAKAIPEKIKSLRSDKWKAIESLYNRNSFKEIMAGKVESQGLPKEVLEKLVKSMQYKAPIAMSLAENLIDQGNGTESELQKLSEIFSTKDALLGLTSIGKRVVYTGE